MYKSLNDAANNQKVRTCHQIMFAPPVASQGSIEVWFNRFPSFESCDCRFVPTGEGQTHAKIGTVAYIPSWKSLFGSMQGNFWSPSGEARELIRSLELHHTSMSVGDVLVVNHPNGNSEIWLACEHSWRQI